MGFLEKASQGIGQLTGQFGGQGNNLLGAAAQLLSSKDVGGMQGLLQMFQQKGLGDVASSWVSTGENRPISAEQVQGALGQERVHEVANQAGVSDQEASNGLAGILPQLIDRLTPDGKVPDNESANSALSQLASKFLHS